MIRIRAVAVLSALAAALPAAPAPAQQPAGEPIPRELAEALAGATGESQIVVGRLPAGFPDVMPADGRVLGGVERRSGRSVAVLTSATPCARVAAEIRARLLREGWTQPPGMAEAERGFVNSGVSGPSGVYCRGPGTVLHVSAVPKRGGGSYVSMYRSEGDEYNPCTTQQHGMMAQVPGNAPLPPLYAPEGAEQFGTGMGVSGNDQYQVSAMVRTELAARALADHYAGQLRQAGWSPAEPVAVEGAAAQTFRFRDGGGRDWHAILFVTETPGTDRRSAELRLNALPREGRRGARLEPSAVAERHRAGFARYDPPVRARSMHDGAKSR